MTRAPDVDRPAFQCSVSSIADACSSNTFANHECVEERNGSEEILIKAAADAVVAVV